jgi:hypothetical protein
VGDGGVVDGEPDPQPGGDDLLVGGVGAGTAPLGLPEALGGVGLDVDVDPAGRIDLGDGLTRFGLGRDGGLDPAAWGGQPQVERIDRGDGLGDGLMPAVCVASCLGSQVADPVCGEAVGRLRAGDGIPC